MVPPPEDDLFPASGTRSEIRLETEDPPSISQGARAVRSGRWLEEAVIGTFRMYPDVKIVDDNLEFHYPNLWQRTDKLLIKQHCERGWTIDLWYIDFRRGIRLPIECKSQVGSGSTDQKLAYTVDCLAKCDQPHFWLILGGGGFHPKVTAAIGNKLSELGRKQKIRGRLVWHEGPLLYRAVEGLVERGEI